MPSFTQHKCVKSVWWVHHGWTTLRMDGTLLRIPNLQKHQPWKTEWLEESVCHPPHTPSSKVLDFQGTHTSCVLHKGLVASFPDLWSDNWNFSLSNEKQLSKLSVAVQERPVIMRGGRETLKSILKKLKHLYSLWTSVQTLVITEMFSSLQMIEDKSNTF